MDITTLDLTNYPWDYNELLAMFQDKPRVTNIDQDYGYIVFDVNEDYEVYPTKMSDNYWSCQTGHCSHVNTTCLLSAKVYRIQQPMNIIINKYRLGTFVYSWIEEDKMSIQFNYRNTIISIQRSDDLGKMYIQGLEKYIEFNIGQTVTKSAANR